MMNLQKTNDIVLRPARSYAFLRVSGLLLFAVGFLILAWCLSALFVFFSILACGSAWYRLLYIRSFRYLVTPEYIRITNGIFFKRTDQVEMYRIKDYIVTQPFILQVFRLMNLVLKATDPENQVIRLSGIPATDLVDTIRERVQNARQHNHIYELS